MTMDKIRKDKNQNIQVFVRLRPLNQRERDIKSIGVIEVTNNREVTVRQSQQTTLTKKFTFDKAFGPNASQLQVYQEVVSPLIEEVLNGYNCTVFAYGQTGTGKTHTMVGEHTDMDTHWQNDPLAGIIPRALSQLFDELRLTNTEYTVRVSYLELYNEELFDLLSTSEDNSKLRIYEDVTRKGANIVNGLEEITVYNKNEVYKIMSQGQERKRVASTLMNAQSSRSHTVFTIVVHMKENSPEGEELVKIGKLNLVDLAGSENISKAGSDNPAKKERARECVNINQSLLTLGRVITALVERHPHIPYRESKLTRILQESLGGRTKTSIIATISPGHKDLEETMSTLEYAHRAKNIQNKPEVNQKMTKKAILKEYAEEIDRLKRDLQAARDKNGVYLASETYAEMTLKDEEQRKEIQELLLKKKAMEDERDRFEGVFAELNHTLETKNNELAKTVSQLKNTKADLATTSQKLNLTKVACEERQHLVEVHASTEATLSAQAQQLLATADVATEHVQCLHHTVEKRKTVESTNLEITKTYREESEEQRGKMTAGLLLFSNTVNTALSVLQSALDTYTTHSTQTQDQNRLRLENLAQTFVEIVNQLKSASSQSHVSLENTCGTYGRSLESTVAGHCTVVQSTLGEFVENVAESLRHARGVNVSGHVANFVQQWYMGASARVTSLRRAHSEHVTRAELHARTACVAQRTHTELRRARHEQRTDKIHACIMKMEEESANLQQRLTEQLSEIQTEREETEARLQQWMEKERKLLEERLAEHAASERNALEARLAKKVTEVEEQKKLLEERMERYKELYEIQLQADKEESQIAEVDLEECINCEDDYAKHVKKFGKQFEEGTDAINIDMEVFSKNVVEVAEHLSNQMLEVLEKAKEHIQQQATNVISQDKDMCKQFVEAVDKTLVNVINTNKNLTDQLIDKIETTNAIAVNELSAVSSSTSELITLTRTHHSQHSSQCDETRSALNSIQAQLNEAIETLAKLETRYLNQEYKIYSPTGKTPSRMEYRYPRKLVATSPHDRILARFRAMRQNNDDECVIIDSEPGSPIPTESADGSVSEDSIIFAAPSPPCDTFKRSPNNKIMKSTSETDIYAIKRQNEQGKENTERSVSHRKPSKLPAPSSLKKPLTERNIN